MKTYQVWYMKPDWFLSGTFGKRPDNMNLGRTHVHLKDMQTPEGGNWALEKIWIAMQGENWSPNGEARSLIEEKGLRHTSMSVGDCLVDADTGEVFLVKNAGFQSIGFDEPANTDGDTSQWNENGEASERDNDRAASRNYRD